MQIQSFQAAGKVTKGGHSRSAGEMSTCTSLNTLAHELKGLDETELAATSGVEYRGFGAAKEYIGFALITDDSKQPRCTHDKLPMNNGALKTMVGSLLKHYGEAARKKELAFVTDGFASPGYTQVTLSGTGLGLYFETKTGKPMGQLTGSL
ncbi:hypothetical protein JST97_02330 [bacterium]|nr:hypothetical protein [bacterium]